MEKQPHIKTLWLAADDDGGWRITGLGRGKIRIKLLQNKFNLKNFFSLFFSINYVSFPCFFLWEKQGKDNKKTLKYKLN